MVQRVSRAEVWASGACLARMQEGLLALVGVAREDGLDDAERLASKLVHLRLFPDSRGRMSQSLLEVGGTLGLVSQFTLLGDARRGRRPSWSEAAPPERARPLLEAVVAEARARGVEVVTGRFGAEMDVVLTNHGPVTVLLDTRGLF